MSFDNHPTSLESKNITIDGDVVDGVVIAGDHNTVNQTIIQKFFNIFKSDAETLEQCNRRILLNHVENTRIKSVLDASLHGADTARKESVLHPIFDEGLKFYSIYTKSLTLDVGCST